MIPLSASRSDFAQTYEAKPTGKLLPAVKNFGSQTEELALNILHRNENTQQTVVVNHYHNGWGYPFWGPMYSPVYVVNPSNRRNDNNALLIIIAGVVGAVATWAAGKATGRYMEASQDLTDVQDFENKLNWAPETEKESFEATAREAISLKERICGRNKTSAAWDLALRVGTVAGCALLIFGACVNPPNALIAAGVAIGGPSLFGICFKWGFDATEKMNNRDAERLLPLAHDLKNL